MLGLDKYIILFFYFNLLFSTEGDVNLIYNSGVKSYIGEEYELAIEKFESIIDKNIESPELYYNLGNTYYRSGNISGAIWAYESCIKIKPNHSNAIHNLKLSNLKVIDRIEIPNPPFYLKYYFSFKNSLNASHWIIVILCILFCIVTLDTISYFTNYLFIKKIRTAGIVIFCIVLLITIHSIITQYSNNFGIIYSNRVEVYSEPNINSTKLFEIHEGLKVSFNEINDNWVEIELLDGKLGWIDIEKIRFIL